MRVNGANVASYEFEDGLQLMNNLYLGFMRFFGCEFSQNYKGHGVDGACSKIDQAMVDSNWMVKKCG